MHAYIGSGPYCYANSLAMVLGPSTPAPAVIETLTGSPFGAQLIAGSLPLFDPYGWDPDMGLDAAVELLGWRCERSAGGTPGEALTRLRTACARGPVLAGPVTMDRLLYQSGSAAPGATPVPVAPVAPATPDRSQFDASDHYVVVLAVEDDTVLLHDPHGHPYATLPAADFAVAWRAETVAYTDTPFVMRAGFVREHPHVTAAEALRRSLPGAVEWLAGRTDLPMPAGTLSGADALEGLAQRVLEGLAPDVRTLLTVFGVRLGTRRLADAAACLDLLGLSEAAAIADGQARLLGGLQHPLVTGDDQALAAGLRRLAPTYERLRGALSAA